MKICFKFHLNIILFGKKLDIKWIPAPYLKKPWSYVYVDWNMYILGHGWTWRRYLMIEIAHSLNLFVMLFDARFQLFNKYGMSVSFVDWSESWTPIIVYTLNFLEKFNTWTLKWFDLDFLILKLMYVFWPKNTWIVVLAIAERYPWHQMSNESDAST